MPTAAGPGDRNGVIEYCVIDEPAALVWAANMAALELHAPMALAEDLETPRMVVFDLDPGPPAAIAECARTALAIRDVLAAVDLEGWPKSSGSKGLQLYVPLNTPCTHEHAASFALAVGQLLERQHPTEILTSMTKADRKGKVFVDWSQNARHKTTIARVLPAGSAAPDGVDPGDVGRGERGCRRPRPTCASCGPTCSSGSRSSATCSRRS